MIESPCVARRAPPVSPQKFARLLRSPALDRDDCGSRQERAGGKPQQDFRRLVRYALDGLFSFSNLPLRMLTYSGAVVGGLGFALGLYYVVKRLVGIEQAQMGFTTLAALVLFLGGVQLIGIGVLGEYLGRIYDEVKRRPVYLVKPPRPRT